MCHVFCQYCYQDFVLGTFFFFLSVRTKYSVWDIFALHLKALLWARNEVVSCITWFYLLIRLIQEGGDCYLIKCFFCFCFMPKMGAVTQYFRGCSAKVLGCIFATLWHSGWHNLQWSFGCQLQLKCRTFFTRCLLSPKVKPVIILLQCRVIWFTDCWRTG